MRQDLPRISLVPRRIGNETIVWAVMNFEPYTLSKVAGSGARKAFLWTVSVVIDLGLGAANLFLIADDDVT